MERNSWAVSSSTGLITTEDARLAMNALLQAGPTAYSSPQGIRPGKGNPGLVVAADPPNTTVTVRAFQMFMQPKGHNGGYIQTLDQDKTIDVLGLVPPPSSDNRFDIIVAQQSDSFYSDTTATAFEVKHIPGVAGSGKPPALPNTAGCLLLATLKITPTDKVISPGMITNNNLPWVVGLGGVAPVRDSAGRDATDAYNGLTVYRQDRRWLEIHDDTVWRVPSVPVCGSLADLKNTVTYPHLGQLVVCLEDGLLYRWDGANWVGAVALGSLGAADRHEARYYIPESPAGQAIPPSQDTRIEFRAESYVSADVTPNRANDTFTLNRSGLWSISVSVRLGPAAAADPETYLMIADNPSIVRYANNAGMFPQDRAASLSCSTQYRFPAGAALSAFIFTVAGRSIQPWNQVNNITFTWLRP